MRFVYAVAAAGMAFAFTATVALAQKDAPQIIQQAVQTYEVGTKDTENYRLTANTMGIKSTTLMKKEIIDGHPVFVPAQLDESMGSKWESPQNWFRQIADRAKYEGSEEVDGYRCDVVSIDNFEGIDVGPGFQSDGEFQPTWMSIAIDENHLPRRFRMKGDMVVEGSSRPVSIEALMTDYREINGMHHPFRILIEADGFMGPGGGSDVDQAEAQKALADFEKSLEEMSDQEREMLEKVMGDKMNTLREMASSGKLKVEMVVTSIEANVAE